MRRAVWFFLLAAGLCAQEADSTAVLPWSGQQVLDSWEGGCSCRFSFERSAGGTTQVLAAAYEYTVVAEDSTAFDETKTIFDGDGIPISTTTRRGHVSEFDELLAGGAELGAEEMLEAAGRTWRCRSYTLRPGDGSALRFWFSPDAPGITLRFEASDAQGQTRIELRKLAYGE